MNNLLKFEDGFDLLKVDSAMFVRYLNKLNRVLVVFETDKFLKQVLKKLQLESFDL